MTKQSKKSVQKEKLKSLLKEKLKAKILQMDKGNQQVQTGPTIINKIMLPSVQQKGKTKRRVKHQAAVPLSNPVSSNSITSSQPIRVPQPRMYPSAPVIQSLPQPPYIPPNPSIKQPQPYINPKPYTPPWIPQFQSYTPMKYEPSDNQTSQPPPLENDENDDRPIFYNDEKGNYIEIEKQPIHNFSVNLPPELNDPLIQSAFTNPIDQESNNAREQFVNDYDQLYQDFQVVQNQLEEKENEIAALAEQMAKKDAAEITDLALVQSLQTAEQEKQNLQQQSSNISQQLQQPSLKNIFVNRSFDLGEKVVQAFPPTVSAILDPLQRLGTSTVGELQRLGSSTVSALPPLANAVVPPVFNAVVPPVVNALKDIGTTSINRGADLGKTLLQERAQSQRAALPYQQQLYLSNYQPQPRIGYGPYSSRDGTVKFRTISAPGEISNSAPVSSQPSFVSRIWKKMPAVSMPKMNLSFPSSFSSARANNNTVSDNSQPVEQKEREEKQEVVDERKYESPQIEVVEEEKKEPVSQPPIQPQPTSQQIQLVKAINAVVDSFNDSILAHDSLPFKDRQNQTSSFIGNLTRYSDHLKNILNRENLETALMNQLTANVSEMENYINSLKSGRQTRSSTGTIQRIKYSKGLGLKPRILKKRVVTLSKKQMQYVLDLMNGKRKKKI